MNPRHRCAGKTSLSFPITVVLVGLAGLGAGWFWFHQQDEAPRVLPLENTSDPARPEPLANDETAPSEPARMNVAEVAVTPVPPPAPADAWVVTDLNLSLAAIKPGTFAMGPDRDDPYRNRNEEMGDGPQTRVTLTKPYWIGVTEVTRAQYAAIMGPTNPPQPELKKEHPAAAADPGRLPAVNMTWDQASEFCRLLTAREKAAGRLKPGFVFALPTEAQWEYACRAHTLTRNYVGEKTEDLLDIAWFVKTTGPFTRRDGPQFRPVQLKKPNAWGLYDMLGNVREWCRDWYAPLPGADLIDPTGPEKPYRVKDREKAFRVIKGGCWIDGQRYVGCGVRDWTAPNFGANPDFREGTVGFRVAAVMEAGS